MIVAGRAIILINMRLRYLVIKGLKMTVQRFLRKTRQTMGVGFAIAIAQFKLRNEDSYLGLFWYLLNPILSFLLMLFIFAGRLGNDIPHYPAYLLIGIIMFNFFTEVTTQAVINMESNKQIIKSIQFPRESLVIANMLTRSFAHAFEIVIFMIISLVLGVSMGGFIFYFPLLLLYSVFLYGFSLILASLFLYFIDLKNIWVFVTKLVFFGTPIFYAIEGQTRLFKVNKSGVLFHNNGKGHHNLWQSAARMACRRSCGIFIPVPSCRVADIPQAEEKIRRADIRWRG